jgi:5-oxoprolinase (ATP-hydrolysing) subunit A
MHIDINCDLGESFGAWHMGHDEALMPYISSANIACGFHAGDPIVMQKTVRMALKYHVAIGAHPGFPDLQGFGRRNLHMTPQEVYAMTLYQIGALKSIAEAEGGVLRHVKPHGALYNMAARDAALADALARATQHAGAHLMLYGLSGSEMIRAAQKIGLRTCSEVFADRSYQPDGSLTPRQQPGALIEQAAEVAARALQMARQQTIQSTDGQTITLQADTICLHGDGAHALEFAQAIFQTFRQENIQMLAPQ